MMQQLFNSYTLTDSILLSINTSCCFRPKQGSADAKLHLDQVATDVYFLHDWPVATHSPNNTCTLLEPQPSRQQSLQDAHTTHKRYRFIHLTVPVVSTSPRGLHVPLWVSATYAPCPPFLFEGNVVLDGWTPGKRSVTFDLGENSFTLTHSE